MRYQNSNAANDKRLETAHHVIRIGEYTTSGLVGRAVVSFPIISRIVVVPQAGRDDIQIDRQVRESAAVSDRGRASRK